MQKGHDDSTLATIGAIIVYFHASHRTTNDEVLNLRPDWKKVSGMLVEALPAQRTGYPCDALRASASRIHHPDNTELLGAIGTRGNKLIGHGAPLPTSAGARSRTATPQMVTCLMPRIFSALPDDKSQEVGGNGQPWPSEA